MLIIEIKKCDFNMKAFKQHINIFQMALSWLHAMSQCSCCLLMTFLNIRMPTVWISMGCWARKRTTCAIYYYLYMKYLIKYVSV